MYGISEGNLKTTKTSLTIITTTLKKYTKTVVHCYNPLESVLHTNTIFNSGIRTILK